MLPDSPTRQSPVLALALAVVALLLLAAVLLVVAERSVGDADPQESTAVSGGGSPGLQIPVPVDPSPTEYVKLTPGDAEFNQFPSEFTDFPIYWVGQEFGGHALRFIIRHIFSPEAGSPTQNSVRFLYDSCGAEKLTDGGCPPPLQIIIQPYCLVPPELLGEGARPAGIEKVRGGADALISGGGLRIWTGDATIQIYASSAQLLEDATAALVSSNGLGPVGAGSALPAPDPDCSGYRMVPQPADRG